MATPKDVARILIKLQFRRRPDIDDDGMESWVDQKGRGNVEVSVSDSGRWVIMWEEHRATGHGLLRMTKALLAYLGKKKQTNEAIKSAPSHGSPKDMARVLTKLGYARDNWDVWMSHGDDAVDEWESKDGSSGVTVWKDGRFEIAWEELRKKGKGAAQLLRHLKSFVPKNEMTGTGAVAGFGTPYAFAGNDEDKKKVNESFEALLEGLTPPDFERFLKQNGFSLHSPALTDPNVRKHRVHGSHSSDDKDTWLHNHIGKLYVGLEKDGTWDVQLGHGRMAKNYKRGRGLPNLKSELSRYLRKQGPGEGINESGGLEVVKGGKVVDTLELPSSGQTATYKSRNYTLQRDKKNKAWYFIDLDKPLNEGGDPYYGWRNDETKTPRQKIGKAITEIHKQLREVERVVKRTQRLKKETGTSNGALWNRTNAAMMKIETRMHKISQTIRKMRG